MTDIAFRSATSLAAAVRRKEIGSSELLELYLERIEKHNPALNAIVTLDAERARARATRADEATARGESWGPMHGLPVTIKDSIETEGLRTTSGAPGLAGHVPTRDATAVARYRTAGAVVFGKTNLPMFAGDWQSYNQMFGTSNNPWDVSTSPGGSSGGSAAAVAAGLTGLELGSDIAGSIRQPAHSCGIYGHKPTHGIVPGRGHIPGPPGQLGDTDLAVIGPLARSAGDIALALGVLAGPDERSAHAWSLRLPPARRSSIREYRIAVWPDDPAGPVDGEVRGRIEAAATALATAGAYVDDKARPAVDAGRAVRTFLELVSPIFGAGLPDEEFDGLAAHARSLPPDDDSPGARYARFTTESHRSWIFANEIRQHVRAAWRDFFTDFDVLLCPASPVPALPHSPAPQGADTRTITVNGEKRPYGEMAVWAGLAGMALLPATVAPAGRTSGGLPVGVQIVGPYLEDRTPIDLAGRLADLIGGFESPPGF